MLSPNTIIMGGSGEDKLKLGFSMDIYLDCEPWQLTQKGYLVYNNCGQERAVSSMQCKMSQVSCIWLAKTNQQLTYCL